jgi:hypothetical protein
MANPTIRIHDIETNEVIDREMTIDELNAFKIEQEKSIADIELKAAQIKAKEAVQIKLAALGLTTDDLKALGL